MTSAAKQITNQNTWVADNFSRLEQRLNGHAKANPVHELRKKAFLHFNELGFPNRRNEDWKYTDVSQISKANFELLPAAPGNLPSAADIASQVLEESAACLVFVNGFFVKELSKEAKSGNDFAVHSFQELLQQGNDNSNSSILRNNLENYSNFKDHSFVALNTAFVADGAFIRIPANVQIEKPIQLLFVTTTEQSQALIQPRLLIIADEGSSCTIVESHLGLSENVYFCNVVTEAKVATNAKVEHYKIQLESASAFHVSNLQIHQADNSQFTTQQFGFGGALVRNEIHPLLDGENIESSIFGLTVINGSQHIDNHTVIDHAKPNCLSNELFKGIYSGKSTGVFNGTIIVRQDAQKTNAIQTNNSLLLSPDASVDTRPQLKIWANDVKCTHGATIGALDRDSLFYLRARGIDEQTATKMLTEAFAVEVLDKIGIPQLKESIQKILAEKLA